MSADRMPPDSGLRVHAGDERLVPMRLQRFLARSGVASRRGSEDLMTAGRVTVNGRVVSELGSKIDPAVDEVAVDGVPVRLGSKPVYLMLNKPAGYLTTMHDEIGRPCVAELVPCKRYPGLFPVGRLDKDTTGLLLFTTDGDMGQRLLHPSRHVWKTYEALVEGTVAERELEPFRQGIEIDDGPCQPARCRILEAERGRRESWIEVSIHEGRKNQVKRMCARIGHPVIQLHRRSFGPLEVGELLLGQWRELTEEEVADLEAGKQDALRPGARHRQAENRKR